MRLPLALWASVVVVLLVAPTLVVIPLSLTDRRSFSFPVQGWSMQWYERFFTDPRWVGSLGTSFALALATGIIATVMGCIAAYAMERTRRPRLSGARGFLLLPIVVPGIVVAVAVFGTYLGWGLSGTFVGLLLAHTCLAIPFVVIPVSTAIKSVDPTLERAAAVLGASPLSRFLQVQMPLIAPGILTGFVFAFITSLDEVVIAYFLQSPTLRTLPVQMYSSVTVETDPAIAVASTLVLALSTTAILVPRLALTARRRATMRRSRVPAEETS